MKTFVRNVLGGLAFAGLTALLPASALADGPQAVGIAAQHAGLAAAAGNMNLARTHLHHVLNCLVGPGGDGFDAAPGNPCANAGGGAIPQTANPEEKTKLLNIAQRVRAGIPDNNLDDLKKVATDAQANLK